MKPAGRRRRRGRRATGVVVAVVALACGRPAPGVPTTAPPSELPSAEGVESPPSAADPRRAEALAQLQRIGIIGASVSAGFGDSKPLHAAVDAALRPPHRVFDASSSAMFLRPLELAEVELGVMRLRGVRMVVAVDFLFWFAAGDKPIAQREADLERGLAMLDTLDVPLFVGDLPDVRGADPRMISPRQIPSPEELARYNARIVAWADARPRVVRLPVAAWTAAWTAGETVEVLGYRRTPGPGLMQADRLHPTPQGQAWLAVLILERVLVATPGLSATDVVADPAAVAERLVGSEPPGEIRGGLPGLR